MKRWIGRVAMAALGLVALVLMVGAVYEAFSRRRLFAQFPLRGELVDVGGRRLQLDCRGAGSPLVVFETGMGTSGSLDWSGVHDAVAASTRACAYSRAGILSSDPSAGSHDATAIADDLHTLLRRAGEAMPIVLVAHSMGGPYAMVFTQKFESDVAGLVLVDTAHPEMKQRVVAAGLPFEGPPLMALKIGAALAWTGLLRFTVDNDAEGAYMPTSLAAMLDEFEVVDRSLAQAGEIRQLGDRPLFVLTADNHAGAFPDLTAEQSKTHEEVWQRMQNEQASWSTRSRHEVVHGVGHRIHEEKPERVVAAVQWVVETVRAAR